MDSLMKSKFKMSVLSACCVTALLLVGCGGSSDNKAQTPPKQPAPTTPAYKHFVAEKEYRLDALEQASQMKVIDYKMQNVMGEQITTSAFVFFPKTEKPADGYKVVVWQHGTLGVADACAPTANVLNARFKEPLAKTLLEAGYVVVAPDYEGLGSKGIHPYLHMDSQAKSSVSAVQAVQERYADQVSAEWMTVGQSQGGQASLGTAEFIAKNPDANYKGAVAAAPASGLDTIIFDIAPQALADAEQKELAAGLTIAQRANGSIGALSTLLTYSAFYAVGVKSYEPRFNYKEVFAADRVANIVELAEGSTGENGLCLDDEAAPEKSLRNHFTLDIAKFLMENPQKGINDYPTLDRIKFYENESLKKALATSQPSNVKIEVPVMIIQGTADMSVPYYVTEKVQDKYKKLGTDVTFIPAVGATHTQAIVQKNDVLLDFIKTHMPAN